MKQAYISIIIMFLLCCTCSKKDADLSFLKNYSKTELNYYLQVGFNKKNKIEKWKENIVVSIDKRFDKQFIEFAKQTIEEIDSLIPNLRVTISDNNPNIHLLLEDPPSGSYGLEQTKFYYIISTNIKESKIWLSPHASSNKLRFNFCHELLHSLGFSHAKSFNEKYSLMGINIFENIEQYEFFYETFNSIPAIDKKALEIHYNENILHGTKRSEIILMFE